MRKIFNKIILILICSFISLNLNANQGKIIGASVHETPQWFKDSFLDINEDIEEAKETNKHIMLFMDLDGCPYCKKMLNENFISENKTSDFIKKYFDVININVKGSREVVWNEDTTLTEKELAQELKIQYSPTILFFNYERDIVVRINGYRSPTNFKYILEYVQGKHYENMTLTQYANKITKDELYTFKQNELFSNIYNLSEINTPIAIIFEDGSCTQCDYFHNKILTNNGVKSELSKFTIIRFNAKSVKKFIHVDGKETTPKQLIEKHNLDYRPGILLYNDKKLISTVDALLYPYHFRELLRYVSEGFYKQYPNSYLDYLKVRQDELINQGKDIDLRE